MGFESFMHQWQTLNSSVETLAAIGAELRLRCEALSGDPGVRSLLQAIAHKVDPGLFDGLDPNQ